MRKLIFLLFFICFNSFAQDYTEKYNDILGRYEYRNANGDMVATKKWNSIMQRWDYEQVDASSNYYNRKPIEVLPVTSNVNLPLVQQVLSSKQSRYKSSQSSVNDLITSMRNFLISSGLPIASQEKVKADFNSTYLSPMYTNGYDPSSKDLINWLVDGFNQIYGNEVSTVNKRIIDEQSSTNQALKQIAYNSGYYITYTVIEEKYNPNTNQYELVNIDNDLTQVYIDGLKNELRYARSNQKFWRIYKWKYDRMGDDFYQLLDTESSNVLYVSKDFSTIVFWEGKIGDTYTQRFTYQNIKKSN